MKMQLLQIKEHETSHFEESIELGYLPKPSMEWDPYLKDIKEIFVDVPNVSPINSIKIALAPKNPSSEDRERAIKGLSKILKWGGKK